MTASTFSTASTPAAGRGPRVIDRAILAGTRPLLRKELAEWSHSRRVWVTFAVVATFMALAAANSWITSLIIANLPPDVVPPEAPVSLDAFENLIAGVSTQIVVVAAIFATMGLLVAERERGTLAWVASKPVGRGAIVLSKIGAGIAALGLAAVVAPMIVVGIVVAVLYGVPALGPVAIVTIGLILAVAVYVAVGIAAATVVTGQAAVAAIAMAVFFLPSIFAAILPVDIMPFLPTSILAWSVGLAMGAPVGVVTPVAWAVGLTIIVAFAVWRLERTEI
jgi:ABC-type transport system involved in multi-copper enzyme maturation permease subunit